MTTITHTSFASLNTDVRMLGDLYSLNDLHHAAGGQEKHSPRHWSRLQQTKDLIAEIEKEQICAIQSKQGLGTFVCKELVCDYAAWISAAFHLAVIRIFLASSAAQLSTKDDRTPLKDAINALVSKTSSLNYSEAYRMVWQRFGVHGVKELTTDQIPQAVEYVHELTLKAVQYGELLPREEKTDAEDIRHHRVCAIAMMHTGRMRYEEQKRAITLVRNRTAEAHERLKAINRVLAAAIDETGETLDLANSILHGSGAIWDGLHEALFHLYLPDDVMKDGKRRAQEHYKPRILG